MSNFDKSYKKTIKKIEKRINKIRHVENLNPIKMESKDFCYGIFYLQGKDFLYFLDKHPDNNLNLNFNFDFDSKSKSYRYNFLENFKLIFSLYLLPTPIDNDFPELVEFEHQKKELKNFLEPYKELFSEDNFKPLIEFLEKANYKEMKQLVRNLSVLETRESALKDICISPDGIEVEKIFDLLVFLIDEMKSIYETLLEIPFIKFQNDKLNFKSTRKRNFFPVYENLILDFEMINNIKNIYEISKEHPEIITMSKKQLSICYPTLTEENFLAFKKVLKHFAKSTCELIESNNRFLH